MTRIHVSLIINNLFSTTTWFL